MGKRKKKPTDFTIARLVLEALATVASLIAAIRWWQASKRGTSPKGEGAPFVNMIAHNKEFVKWKIKIFA